MPFRRRIAFINPAVSTENVGDLFIVDSLKKILVYDEHASVDVDPRKPITQREIDQINAADCAVITGTNLWYRRMAKPGRWTFTIEQLRQIKVPIIPWGVGTTRHAGEDNGFEPETLEQIKHIHESCRMGSARDWRTVEALRDAGITNVAMTGCPTLFRSLNPSWELKRKESKQIVITVRKGQRHNVRALIRLARERGLEPIIAAQQDPDRFLSYSIPFIQRAVPTLYRYDIRPYRRLVDESLGAIGWRLHGNMFHLAHGNPAVLFSNCSRSESFCESFGLPVVRCEDGEDLSDETLASMLDKLIDPATFALLPERYAQFRAAMAKFLEDNELEHRLREGASPPPQQQREDAVAELSANA